MRYFMRLSLFGPHDTEDSRSQVVVGLDLGLTYSKIAYATLCIEKNKSIFVVTSA